MHIILGAPKEGMIKSLIQSEGVVIGVDRGALIAVEEGIELDIALGDFDSVSKNEKLKIKKYAGEILGFLSDKDDTDGELALLYVLDNIEAANIYLYNWYGGRVDHFYSLLMLVLQKRFLPLVSKIKFIAENNYISYYLTGEHIVRKLKNMKYLSFILLSSVERLTLNGVKYPLREVNFDSSRALISNEFLNEKASFSFEKGIVAVIQSRDAD